MATASVTYNFTNATTADATQVDQNFTDVTSFVNTNAIQKDGSLAMTADLVLSTSGAPSGQSSAVPLGYVNGPYVHAKTGTAQLYSSGVYLTTIFTTEVFDTASAYNLATGVFTAPIAGIYLVSFNAAYIANSNVEHGMRVNLASGSQLFEANVIVPSAVNTVDGPKMTMSVAIAAQAGQTIQPQIKCNTTFSLVMGDWLTISWLHG